MLTRNSRLSSVSVNANIIIVIVISILIVLDVKSAYDLVQMYSALFMLTDEIATVDAMFTEIIKEKSIAV